MADDDTKLDAQAQAMAEKALEKLPMEIRAAKIGKVKEGILKQLKAKAVEKSAPSKSSGAPPAAAAPVRPPMVAPVAAPPPPPARGPLIPPLEMLPGICMCGDERWFSDPTVRKKLQDKIIAAHAEQKILVGPPADEIHRICPGGGRVIMAGAVLRLGGNRGAFGESDVAYAYRQLSRALHPDKNPGIPEASDAFRRLSEAADELRQGLTETRNVLKAITDAVGGSVSEEDLKRPQEALFAEATRILYGVLGLCGEGTVPAHMVERAGSKFVGSWILLNCESDVFCSLWYNTPHLLDCLGSVSMRAAFDCSPKHLRAQFLSALNRVMLVEEKRVGNLRANWQRVIMSFPEMGIWRELRALIEERIAPKTSKWDETAADVGKSWRAQLTAALSKDREPVLSTESVVRKIAADVWEDVADWARNNDAMRQMELFRADGSESSVLCKDLVGQRADWSFVPAADLFLLLCDGQLGITHEGLFLKEVIEAPESDKKSKDEEPTRDKDDEDQQNGKKDPKQQQMDAQKREGFDWEKTWRSKRELQQFRGRQAPRWQRGHSPPSRSRSRDRRRRRRSESRDRRRRRRPSSSRSPRR